MGLYKKPVIKTYSADDLLEELGPGQSQYGSTGGTTTFYTTTGNASVNVDGVVESTGLFFGNFMDVGDRNPTNDTVRMFVGFDISSIQGRTIVSATLRIYQYNISNNPYDLGNLVVDHVNFGSSLDSTDYSGGTLTSNIGTISTSGTIEWKTRDVTNYVQEDINNSRTASQFRLRFETLTDSDAVDDLALFEDVENYGGTGNKPELVITYR